MLAIFLGFHFLFQTKGQGSIMIPRTFSELAVQVTSFDQSTEVLKAGL